jgi:hypothetical protein
LELYLDFLIKMAFILDILILFKMLLRRIRYRFEFFSAKADTIVEFPRR